MTDRASPLLELVLSRVRLFIREPSAVFWTFGFPLLLTVALGVAFRDRPPEPVFVAVQEGPGAEPLVEALAADEGVRVRLLGEAGALAALRTGRVSLVVVPGSPRTYLFDPQRPDSRLARAVTDDRLQRAEGRTDPTPVQDRIVVEPGSRYIDFFVPGLIGMNVMSSGLWGIGYMLVDMRTRKLLKRLVATPMRRRHLLFSFAALRMLFLLVELPVLLGVAWLLFGVTMQGSPLAFVGVALLGAAAFAGIGLLLASRAQNTHTVGGLINLVMLPMFLFSGVFFSNERFPEVMQPVIRVLPLTALVDALRAVMNEGAGWAQLAEPLALLAAFAFLSYAIALRIFRWS